MTVEIETPPEKRKVTCKSCGAKLTYLFEDIKTSSGCSYGDFEISNYIKCPQANCGSVIYVQKQLKE